MEQGNVVRSKKEDTDRVTVGVLKRQTTITVCPYNCTGEQFNLVWRHETSESSASWESSVGPVSRGQVMSRADPVHGIHFVASLKATVLILVDAFADACHPPMPVCETGLSPRTAAARLLWNVGQQTQANGQDVKHRFPQHSARDLLDLRGETEPKYSRRRIQLLTHFSV